MADRSAPGFILSYVPQGGDPIRVDVEDRVLSFRFTDSTKKADVLSLTVDNYDLSQFDVPYWLAGSILEVTWGYPGNTTPLRRVVVRKVTGFSTLTIEAHGTAVLFDTVKRTRVFERMTRAAVVRQVAQENNVTVFDVQEDADAEVYDVIPQGGLTDAQLCAALAKKEKFDFFVGFDGLHWHPPRLGKKPIRSFRYFTDPGAGDVLEITSLESSVTARPGKVTLKGQDPRTKAPIEVVGSNQETQSFKTIADERLVVDQQSGQQTFQTSIAQETVVATPVATATEAKRRADALYRDSALGSVKIGFKVVGDPGVMSGVLVELLGIGERHSGTYEVTEAAHELVPGSYTVAIQGRRDGVGSSRATTGSPQGVAPQQPPNQQAVTPQDPDALEEREVVDQQTGQSRTEYGQAAGRTPGDG